MTNVKLAMEYAAKIEREAIKNGTTLGAAFDKIYDKQEWTKIFGPKKEWVGLTGTEINHIFAANAEYPERMIQAAEAILKEKNGG